MNRFQRTMGKICDNCPLCNYARRNPETPFGKVMSWHGKYCPAWKAQQEIAAEREVQKRRDGDAETRREENSAE
jgi:hypothetical protein